MNRSTGTAHPSQETLAKDLDASDRTVRRLLTMLEPLGLAIDPGDGRGNASTYRLETRTNDPSLDGPKKADMGDLFSPIKADADVHLSDTNAKHRHKSGRRSEGARGYPSRQKRAGH